MTTDGPIDPMPGRHGWRGRSTGRPTFGQVLVLVLALLGVLLLLWAI